ncbi:hypothetical protein [Leptospira levettii]|uniref:hypothetical protein n=1 Tax=Leptospira levettii TaxID=2023178 RepID=UPI0010833DB9|nr:hypothetical protein [Leptospira levettii]MCW7467443.1 hypothetical protein [Leptospira levettii]MCW7513165.1 hypothetical protein [Leptospira levettii]TGL11146.1 hypothetical protein EHQ39_07745 [Leptospira levettii]TGM26338.1 hypothetical protein EHQ74_10505 [Leptospira levettii]TGM88107.1 hypothetical protein EHR00_00705 [Leptospira levettii]
MLTKIILPILKYIILFLIINCSDLNRLPNFLKINKDLNKYSNYIDPNLKKYLISTNELWISIDENDLQLKRLEVNNFKDTKYTLKKGNLFEIIGGYPSIENAEYFLIYLPNDTHWVSSKIKKQKALENFHIKPYFLEQSDFGDSKILAAKSGGIQVYEKPDFKSKVLLKVYENENFWLWEIKPEIKNVNPLFFVSVTDIKDRNFDKLGNWINVTYKNLNGYVFSTDVIPILDHCANLQILNKSNKFLKKGALLNSFGDNILNRFSLRDNLWGILKKSDKSYSFAITKTAYYCRELRNFHIVKIIDVKTILSQYSNEFESTKPGGGNIFCKNPMHSGTDMFIIYNEEIAKNDIKNTFSIDTQTEKIIEIESKKTICEDICAKFDCD